MKSKFITLFGMSCVLFTTSVLAWNNPYDNNSGDRYQGSSGTTYQYDLSNPGDQIGYSVDVGAQMRDEISIDVGRDIDRSMGLYGGGIYDD